MYMYAGFSLGSYRGSLNPLSLSNAPLFLKFYVSWPLILNCQALLLTDNEDVDKLEDKYTMKGSVSCSLSFFGGTKKCVHVQLLTPPIMNNFIK